MEKLFNYLPGAIVIILVIAGLTEMFVSATWRDVYFKKGVLVINKCISVYPHHTNIPNRDLLEKRFKSGWFSFTSSLIFRELDTNIYAFREGLFARSLSRVHGVLIFDEENNQVSVKGFYNWTMFCFWSMWLIIPPSLWLSGFLTFYDPPAFIVSVYLIVTLPNLGIPYLIDYVRLSDVANFAAQSWSRKHAPIIQG